VVSETQGVKNQPHRVKKVCVWDLSLITPSIMNLEKHSRAHCKAYEYFFVTVYKYTSQFVKLQSYVMNFGN
jgi:hypothetical protein